MDTIAEFVAGEPFRNALVAFGVLVALVSVKTARDIARKKQTADLLFATRGDEKLQKGYRYISEYSATTAVNIAALGDRDSEDEHADAVRYVLNHLEAVSVCITHDIYDEDMLRKCWYTVIVQTYDRTQPLISHLRRKQNRDTLLQEFETLAVRWKRNPLRKTQ